MPIIAAVVAFNMVFAKDDPVQSSKGTQRIREGTRLFDVSGKFEAVGDRVNFVFGESGESVRVLENLALQRVSRVLTENQGSPQWTVSGTVTEYNNANFLLLTKAVQAGKSAAKEPAAASGIGTRPKVDYSDSQVKKPGEKNQESPNDSRP